MKPKVNLICFDFGDTVILKFVNSGINDRWIVEYNIHTYN